MVTQDFYALMCYVHRVQPMYINEMNMSHMCDVSSGSHENVMCQWLYGKVGMSAVSKSLQQVVFQAFHV